MELTTPSIGTLTYETDGNDMLQTILFYSIVAACGIFGIFIVMKFAKYMRRNPELRPRPVSIGLWILAVVDVYSDFVFIFQIYSLTLTQQFIFGVTCLMLSVIFNTVTVCNLICINQSVICYSNGCI